MAFRDYARSILPVTQVADEDSIERAATSNVIDIEKFSKAGVRLFKVKTLALNNTIGFNLRGRFEVAPYDFERIIRAYETDSYLLQAFSKYKELMWKEGWDIVSENSEASDYLYERIGYMEYTMRRTFQDLLSEISDQLIKFNNAFVAKSRSEDMDQVGSGIIGDQFPIAGYYVIPAETVEIERNKHNKPLRYRQRVSSVIGGFGGDNIPTWQARDVIHFSLDKRPGAAFGTPFVEPVLDDVIALRQIEEDIQNLIHKELFPLYKYQVGTETSPATDDEIENAINELENLRTDGGLVLPERHDVDVVGAQNTALEGEPYLNYFLTRVTAGLGLSPHHLGILNSGANRSVTDRLDIALYDKVKTYQRYFADMIRLHVFTELLIEGGFNPLTHPKIAGESDWCEFRFREIDIDSAVKKENHSIHKYSNNVIGLNEVRLQLNMDPEVDEESLQQGVMTRLMPEPTVAGDGSSQPQKPNAQKSATKGQTNQPNRTKSTGNRNTPSNQHGTRTSPNIRHSINEQWLTNVVDLLQESEIDKEQT